MEEDKYIVGIDPYDKNKPTTCFGKVIMVEQKDGTIFYPCAGHEFEGEEYKKNNVPTSK